MPKPRKNKSPRANQPMPTGNAEVASERETHKKRMKLSQSPHAEQPLEAAAPPAPSSSGASSRLDKYRAKLEGAKFRLLNESLYSGKQDEISAGDFEQYHTGFKRQVEKWPSNPVQVILRDLQARAASLGKSGGDKGKQKKGLDKKPRKVVVGDFGCGDAEIAHTLEDDHRFKVHSFDLVSTDKLVTACDVSKSLPLPDGVLDVGIFSLSLMNQDVTSYVLEANRVLKPGGELLVAEVKSRFADEEKADGERRPSAPHGGQFRDEEGEMEASRRVMEIGLKRFRKEMKDMGFNATFSDSKSNKMFVLFKFTKVSPPGDGKVVLKSCPYKRR